MFKAIMSDVSSLINIKITNVTKAGRNKSSSVNRSVLSNFGRLQEIYKD